MVIFHKFKYTVAEWLRSKTVNYKPLNAAIGVEFGEKNVHVRKIPNSLVEDQWLYPGACLVINSV